MFYVSVLRDRRSNSFVTDCRLIKFRRGELVVSAVKGVGEALRGYRTGLVVVLVILCVGFDARRSRLCVTQDCGREWFEVLASFGVSLTLRDRVAIACSGLIIVARDEYHVRPCRASIQRARLRLYFSKDFREVDRGLFVLGTFGWMLHSGSYRRGGRRTNYVMGRLAGEGDPILCFLIDAVGTNRRILMDLFFVGAKFLYEANEGWP